LQLARPIALLVCILECSRVDARESTGESYPEGALLTSLKSLTLSLPSPWYRIQRSI